MALGSMIQDGTPCELIRASDLLVGDLIVARSRRALSHIAASLTKGQYSHFRVVVDEGEVVEAVPKYGVRCISVGDAAIDDEFSVAYRHYSLSPAKQDAMREFLQAQLGKPYDYQGLARAFLWPHSRRSNVVSEISREKFHCASLVSNALKVCELLVGEHKDLFSPNEFTRVADTIGFRPVGQLRFE